MTPTEARRADIAIAKSMDGKLCSDCPPRHYPTDRTRCADCPRRKPWHPYDPMTWRANEETPPCGTPCATAAEIATLRAALTQAEACMSIVEPPSDRAEYLRVLGVVRAALAGSAPSGGGERQ
jgi:hypothetical protein